MSGRLLAALAVAASIPVAASGAAAPEPEPERAARAAPKLQGPDPNPCIGGSAGGLRCPDLRMKAPYDLHIDRRTVRGRRLLRAANSIDSRGRGPAALVGRRDGPKTMAADQLISTTGGGVTRVRTPARLYFQPVPGRGRYWKFADAARFELWELDAQNRRLRLARVGPKQNYCLRDLRKTRRLRFTPPRRRFPACSQDPDLRSVVLGTSPGWSDVYSYRYPQNWIDVTGLRGRFAFVHIADPENGIHETNEDNNEAETIVSLPSGRAEGEGGPAPPAEVPADGGYGGYP